jgi:nitronate monooxygenase
MDTVFIRALQSGDPDGAFRRALASFPDQDMTQRVMEKYFLEGGKEEHASFKHLPMWSLTPQQSLLEVTVMANYCEVWLAKHNDDGKPTGGLVGMNLLTKVQLPTVPSLYGAMLADVDYVIMGAGIPMAIPGILDNLADAQDCVQTINVEGTLLDGSTPEQTLTFSPSAFWNQAGKPELNKALKRPDFVPIVSSVVLAQSMLKRASGKGPTKGINGFVVELNTAGGHNAPPRGANELSEKGEPVYGPKDDVDLVKFQKSINGLPFWMAGSYAKPEKFAYVKELGGAGVQVGTAFALCQESGMQDDVRQGILKELFVKDLEVFTDPVASPTGFPFKVLSLEGTLASPDTYSERERVCNLGYLRVQYVRPDGKLGYRCPSEPVEQFVKKGGSVEETEGRKCLCNALCADAGFPQTYTKKDGSSFLEPSLVTIGDDVNNCRKFIQLNEKTGRYGYSACDVIDYLVGEWKTAEATSEAIVA